MEGCVIGGSIDSTCVQSITILCPWSNITELGIGFEQRELAEYGCAATY